MGGWKRRRSHVLFWGVIVWYSWNLLNGRGIHWAHAGPNGGILTKRSVNWRNINGILIRTKNTQTFIHFRRLPWYLVKRRRSASLHSRADEFK